MKKYLLYTIISIFIFYDLAFCVTQSQDCCATDTTCLRTVGDQLCEANVGDHGMAPFGTCTIPSGGEVYGLNCTYNSLNSMSWDANHCYGTVNVYSLVSADTYYHPSCGSTGYNASVTVADCSKPTCQPRSSCKARLDVSVSGGGSVKGTVSGGGLTANYDCSNKSGSPGPVCSSNQANPSEFSCPAAASLTGNCGPGVKMNWVVSSDCFASDNTVSCSMQEGVSTVQLRCGDVNNTDIDNDGVPDCYDTDLKKDNINDQFFPTYLERCPDEQGVYKDSYIRMTVIHQYTMEQSVIEYGKKSGKINIIGEEELPCVVEVRSIYDGTMKSYGVNGDENSFLGDLKSLFPCSDLPGPITITNERNTPDIASPSTEPSVDPGSNIPDGVYIPAGQTSTVTSTDTSTGQTCNVCTSMTTMNNNAAATTDGIKTLLPIAKNIDENLQKSVSNDKTISGQISEVNTNLKDIDSSIHGIGTDVANSIDTKFVEGSTKFGEVITVPSIEGDLPPNYLYTDQDADYIKQNINEDLQLYKTDLTTKSDTLRQLIMGKISITSSGGSCSTSFSVWGRSIEINFCDYDSHISLMGNFMLAFAYLSAVVIVLRA